ncbi:MAG: hypothetical protein JNL08_16180 [Planctomycetes bacterium]|nr:hypothetical protein [Planctomycetota bacterium]
MRRVPSSILLLFGACAAAPANPADPARWPVAPATVVDLPPGTPVLAELAPGLPDEPTWRAAAIWWREALRQSPQLELRETAAGDVDAALCLAVDVRGHTLTATLRQRGRDHLLAGAAFGDGDLPAAIDRLAFTARTALGERPAPPVPVALATSARPEVVTAVHDAALLLRDGGATAARRALREARRADGAAPAVLDGLAAVELLRGDAAAAEALCTEALGYTARLQPTTEHRLARTLLLARASQRPERAADRDRELLALGEAVARERPHDLHGQLTLAIARNFTGAFAAARPLLERLRAAMPDQPIVAYHLGMACLGTGCAAAASAAFDAAALRLPANWVAVPRAIARFEAGDRDGLAALLDGLEADALQNGGPLHDVRRMQAASALLDGRLDAARERLRTDLQWLAQNPSALDGRSGEFAEQGAVLVRLGGAEDLTPVLAVLQQQAPSAALADACAFLAGLAEVTRTRERATTVEERLGRGGDSAWSALLAAFAHELRGEVLAMQTELARAARLSDAPLTKALLARSLRAVGREPEAAALQTALRRELRRIHLRQPLQHPLLGPELAFAFRAD